MGEAGSGAAAGCRGWPGRLWLGSAWCCRAHVGGGRGGAGGAAVSGAAGSGRGWTCPRQVGGRWWCAGRRRGRWGRCRTCGSGSQMASKVSSRQQAMAKARERRSALDQDRVARDRRVEEATAQVLLQLQLQERAAVEQAVQVANAEIGAVLRRLLQDEGIAAQGVGALVDLTVGEVRRLTRAVPAAVGEGQVQATGGAAGGTGAAVAWRRCRPWRGVISNCAGSCAKRWWTPTCTSTTRASTARPAVAASASPRCSCSRPSQPALPPPC